MTQKARNTGRPSKAAGEAKSLRIIETASRLFAEQGYAATSVEQVVAACGVGKDTVYRRFPSKLALFAGVVEHARRQTQAHFQATMAAQTGDVLARLRGAARWLLTVNLDPTLIAFQRIALSEALVVGQAVADNPHDPIMDRLLALIEEAQAAGVLGPGDVRFLAAHLLNCIAIGPTVDAMLGKATYASTRAQNAYFEKAWALFLNGARQGL
ncbi:TetR/AcrR family transcriptional regulator [Rhodoplanes sp. TEM]|uniref:TetR/AcrR family transcriptional regulator n=1 Tax=Rhodoplanes tepidamans TaxID=200616 RepID=A0ABT5JK34_RHOTP|nr:MULTISPECIES: TetR/AcrR family transcriptional regulator [Rhodoplanes]MDC7789848.1 TetR/AcrR family transcriptional regulator [Rhodoplanes tepidamans]MDC7987782.1 TetR/AcrR family transcriptional regulator [Rhodoplanes sp. TEM]MDQ0358499.1 AcrR family transcriptional regulator [Rhodoplanes tepidamans]